MDFNSLEMSRNRVWRDYNGTDTYTEISRNSWTSKMNKNGYFLGWNDDNRKVNLYSESNGQVRINNDEMIIEREDEEDEQRNGGFNTCNLIFLIA